MKKAQQGQSIALTDIRQSEQEEEKWSGPLSSTLRSLCPALPLAFQPDRIVARPGPECLGREEGIQNVLTERTAKLVGYL